jgi:hypothetical protein
MFVRCLVYYFNDINVAFVIISYEFSLLFPLIDFWKEPAAKKKDALLTVSFC